ncbi:MAG: thioredoxin domain-containing protein [Acidimicrobiales bacterium]|nr:thioredoxin domain-containing protein [Acidimicrobiales bacterium]
MTRNVKIPLGLVLAAGLVLVFVANTSGDRTPAPASGSGEPAAQVVREDSQRLSVAEDGEVTFVEFLDYECEACGAAYPAIEALRETYDGRVTFVVRNFPLHNNSEAAARAAEAAAEQGKFDEMYSMLFETQADWGEQSESKQELFFQYAEDLGLDMDQFAADYDDPAILERIEQDQADGQALGVEGTPSFFLNGEKMEISSFEDLTAQIDEALAQ